MSRIEGGPSRARWVPLIASVLALVAACANSESLPVPADPPRHTTSGPVADSIFMLIRTKSVHRREADWSAIEQAFRSRVSGAGSRIDTLNAFREVFASMDDVHSSVYHEGGQVAYFRPASPSLARRVSSLVERAGARQGDPAGTMVAPTVGYLLIPSIFAGVAEGEAHAARIRESICELHAAGATQWIVDLRLNMGGSMHPMLTGLGPLIGDGPIGGIVDGEGREMAEWAIGNGRNLVNGKSIVTRDLPGCDVPADRPIAVLLGPVTMSSGQIVAVALIGRRRTRSFGQASADGYTTANEWMDLGGGVALNLAVGYITDRSGRVYRRLVEPDVTIVGAEDFDDLRQDAAVAAALAWLADSE